MTTAAIQQQDVNRSDYVCTAASEMLLDIRYVRDVAKGTRHMRALGTAYLPREEAETDADYAIRLSRAVLVSFYSRAVNSLVGMVFKEEPTFGEDVPEVMCGREEVAAQPAIETLPAIAAKSAIEGQLENCDLAGTHWTVFAKELFKDAMQDGHAFLLTEMPPALPAGATKADETAAGRRPYWVKYKADQAINWRVDGYGRLTQITLEECSNEADGEYGEKEVTRYRVLRPGSWELYKKVGDGKGGYLVTPDPDNPSGTTSLSEIPLSVVYGKYICPLVSAPPLLDMAVVNVAHYNESSDYRVYLHICSRPILWAAGRNTQSKAPVLSARTLVDVAKDGSMGFAETNGASLGAARQDLKDLEEYMGMLGLQMLAEQTAGPKTATEEHGDQIRELSELATAAQSLKDCLESGLRFWAQYLDSNATSGGSISLGAKEESLMGEQAARVFLDSAGVVFSKPTVRKILAKAFAAFIPEDYSEASESAAIDEEAAKARENMPDVGAQIGKMFNAGAVE